MSEVIVDKKGIVDKADESLKDPSFGLFLAHEWKRLINPYTPHREGNLERNVTYEPFLINYNSPYAHYQYEGVNFNFLREFNPFATYHWDKAAEQAGQKDKLITAANDYLRRG